MKVPKSFIFLVKSFLSNFVDIWRFFTGHTGKNPRLIELRTHTIGGSTTTVQVISCKTCWDFAVSAHTNNGIFSCLIQYQYSKRETSRTVIIPPTARVPYSKGGGSLNKWSGRESL